MRNSLKKFVLLTLLAVTPVMLLVALYAYRDPFHVVHPLASDSQHCDSVVAGNNAGFTTVEIYLAHNNERHYDSFIFGSSMSQNYKASYWQPYINDGASILHFDASAETLDGMINKMHFLNRHGSIIKNALIIIEVRMLHMRPLEEDILFVQHPATSGSSWLHFHSLFFRAFLNLNQVSQTLFPASRDVHERQEEEVEGFLPRRIEAINESYYATIDSLIIVNPERFFTPELLARRIHVELPKQRLPDITPEVEEQLREIKQILDSNNTNYIILVPPCNVAPQLQWCDLWLMRSIFGENRVHDFSGYEPLVNNEYCYYDKEGHLISAKCKMILDSAYRAMQELHLDNPYYTTRKAR